jgi:hypothetical protein
MKIEELQEYIQNLSPELYSFAYVLIPDDLQASQLMIDSVQAFIVQKKILIDKMGSSKNRILRNLLDETKLYLLRIIFDLSRKRYQQLKMSFKDVEQSGGFFALEFDEKAVLYLKDKAAFGLEDIEFITSSLRSEVLSHLYSARVKMVELMHGDLFQNEISSGGIV